MVAIPVLVGIERERGGNELDDRASCEEIFQRGFHVSMRATCLGSCGDG